MKSRLLQLNPAALALLVGDLLLLGFAFQYAYANSISTDLLLTDGFISLLAVYGLGWLVSAFINRIYRAERLANREDLFFDLASTFLVHLIIVLFYVVNLNVLYVPGKFILSLFGLGFSLVLAYRLVAIPALRAYKEAGVNAKKVVILGASEQGMALYNFFTSFKTFGYRFMGFFDHNTQGNPYREMVLGNLADMKEFCKREEVDEIYVALPNAPKSLIDELAKFADDHFMYLRIAAEASQVLSPARVYYYDEVPVATLRNEPLASKVNQALKRLFDIMFSSAVLLVLCLTVFPVIALLIKLEDPAGPVFFSQMRPGRKNKLFRCYKFRSMRVNQSTELQATKNDPRVTRIGAILRRTSLDELPQFFNVLIGDMSVVGPRPNMIKQLEMYSQLIDKYQFRHFVTPGITGYAQVNGFRGETPQVELMAKRVEYDVQYMEKWSLWFDVKIIALTAINMIRGEKNAY